MSTRVPIRDMRNNAEAQDDPHQRATDRNTLVFKLAVSCNKPDAARNNQRLSPRSGDFDSVYGNNELDEIAARTTAERQQSIETPGRPYTQHIYSRDLEWIPQGEQAERFTSDIRPVHEDILLAKLRPGQSIELEAHAHRGNGKDHAKYSPVATACYRLMPRVEIVSPVYDDLAEELVHVLEPGVFCLVETDDQDPPGTKVKAQVSNPYACTMSRNFLRNPKLSQSIRMTRIPNHFIFSVESVGMSNPAILVAEALRQLQGKCTRIMELVDGTDTGMEVE